jgi:hypothetical protein
LRPEHFALSTLRWKLQMRAASGNMGGAAAHVFEMRELDEAPDSAGG